MKTSTWIINFLASIFYAGIWATFLYFGYIMWSAGFNPPHMIICQSFNRMGEYKIEMITYIILLMGSILTTGQIIKKFWINELR